MSIHTPSLLAFLDHRADATRSPLVQAIYAGLAATGFGGGDFDDKEDSQ